MNSLTHWQLFFILPNLSLHAQTPFVGDFLCICSADDERVQALSGARRFIVDVCGTRQLLDVAFVGLQLVIDGWVRAWRHRGKGPRFVRFGRAVRYLAEDLADFIDACRIDTHRTPSATVVADEETGRAS